MKQALRRSYARFCAVGCSTDDLAELDRVDGSLLKRLEYLTRHLTGSNLAMPAVRVYCFGSRVTPQDVRDTFVLPDGSLAAGLCSAEQRIVVARFNEQVPLGRVLTHELGHAVLAGLTDRFPYPPSIAEGYAEFLCSLVWPSAVHRVSCPVPDKIVAPAACVAGPCFSVAELLEQGQPIEPGTSYPPGFHSHSAWLVDFLGGFGQPPETVRERLLGALWHDNVRDPHEVYAWILAACCCSPAELERRYRDFHRRLR